MKAIRLRRFQVFIASLFFALVAASSWADEAEIREQIQLLADDNEDVRLDATLALSRTRDERLVPLFKAYQEGMLFHWNGRVVLVKEMATDAEGEKIATLLDPLTREPLLDNAESILVPARDLRELSPAPKERRLISNLIRFLRDFSSADPDKRLATARRLGDSRNSRFIESLELAAETDPDSRVRRAAQESALLLQLTAAVPGQTVSDRQAAARELGNMHSSRGANVLKRLLNNRSLDSETRQIYQAAVDQIERYQFVVGTGQNLFNGISQGSVLVLMALGLAIIFGQMRVINMAHGELMMIGAYATYEMQLLFGHTPENPVNLYYLAALPVAFLSAALVGYIIELIVVRHLYGRPLETLLATWGIGLILIQAVRVKYGDNIGVNSPTWLVGNAEPIHDFVVPYNRGFILVLCAACVICLYGLMRYTRLGLLIRATVQDRETADSLGVNTRRIDGYAFALGSGLAGLAGYGLTVLGGVTPDMGQNYIVDSFLVVVAGGVGNLAGVVCAGLGIGALNKIAEPLTFGQGLLVAGLLMASISWVMLTVKAFRRVVLLSIQWRRPWIRIASKGHSQDWTWALLCTLVPIFGALAFAFKFSSSKGVPRIRAFHIAGWVAVAVALLSGNLIGLLGDNTFATSIQAIMNAEIQAIWAKVLILVCVVVFIQLRPMGLFAPKGRLADA